MIDDPIHTHQKKKVRLLIQRELGVKREDTFADEVTMRSFIVSFPG